MFWKKKSKKDIYLKAVQAFREERRKTMKSFNENHSEIISMIRRFNGIDKISISFNDLDALPILEWVDINSKVKVRKFLSTKKRLEFDTIMEDNGEFGWHYHDDCTEIVTVLKGCLVDLIDNQRYKADEEIIYVNGQEHIPVAIGDTFLRVTFLK